MDVSIKIVRLWLNTLLICLGLIYSCGLSGQGRATLKGVITNMQNQYIEDVLVYLENGESITSSDIKGVFSLELLDQREHNLIFTGATIGDFEKAIFLNGDTTIFIQIEEVAEELSEVVIQGESDVFGIRRLRSSEEGGLYEGKKTEVIDIEKLIANKAANNARQALSKVPSLNIWESDNAGLQLDIGGRGLSPKRTTNFNTRQNGYDISADPLGYPESYYTPPFQAVEQIEIVRGAGALQYGSQFGGLVNFKMKKGSTEKPITIESHNSYGANKFFNTFNEIHGQSGKVNYYSYLQYKRGDGGRPNSEFDQYGAYGAIQYEPTDRFKINFEYTYMHYLSQQAGGLTDEQFELDPMFSNRERNWFRVNWNLAAISLQYDLTNKIKLYNKTYGLAAQRTSLGLLDTPDIEDPLSNRDLIDGKFRNIGNETRVVINYPGVEDLDNTLLLGTRIYRGFTNFSQQFGTDGSDADFTRVDISFLDRRKSDFDFPSLSAAFFAEKIIRLSPQFSLIPGLRFEHIKTESDGYFTSSLRINSFGDFIEEVREEETENIRNVFLYGLGASHKLSEDYELYANATANYRAINFTDVRIQTNTQLVDTLIQDESGFSFDLGLRKRNFEPFYVEGGLFYILYNDRIGEIIDDGLRVRTNIGSARIFGVELFAEVDILSALNRVTDHTLSAYVNGSVNRGVYTEINDRALVGVRSGNKLQDIPDYNIKTGINYGYGKFATSLQVAFVGEQFSDAANTETPFVGVFGTIPAYEVMDLSCQYKVSEHIDVSASVNNLLNKYYFSRRALAYPGPGIIPALGRTWNVTLSSKF